MRNLLLTIRYNGSRYHGYQVQPNAATVAETFQDAVEAVIGSRDPVTGCSRTDAGVHANRYCVGLRTACAIPCDRLVAALNTRLPDDIAVLACREVPPDFHPRYSAQGKQYIYKLHNSAIKDPFLQDLAYRYRYPLDAEQLDRAAKAFLGTHDFTAFCAAGQQNRGGNVRTIHRFDVWREGEMVYFAVAGNGFLYNMVRILVGTLLAVAQGRIDAAEIPAILASKDRSRAGDTAPACGLYLDQVFYE